VGTSKSGGEGIIQTAAQIASGLKKNGNGPCQEAGFATERRKHKMRKRWTRDAIPGTRGKGQISEGDTDGLKQRGRRDRSEVKRNSLG